MNIAFAGFRHGHIFALYNSAINDENVNVVGCFEENEEEKQKTKESHDINFNYTSYEELLNDDKVEAVAIGDYYGKRGKMIIEALKNNKHVICDKPICTDLDELDEIEQLAKSKNLQVCCMLDLRYLPQVEKVKQIIENGDIGKINIVSFTGQHCLGYGTRPGWYFEDGKHGGTINDLAIHGIDLVRFLTGKNLSKIHFARSWNSFADKEPQFKDCAQFNIEMDGMVLSADVSYSAPSCCFDMPTYWDFYLWGTEGMVHFNLNGKNIHVYKDKEEIIDCEETKIDYLNDFIKETKGIKTIMNTMDIINSQRQVLQIQKYVDGKED